MGRWRACTAVLTVLAAGVVAAGCGGGTAGRAPSATATAVWPATPAELVRTVTTAWSVPGRVLRVRWGFDAGARGSGTQTVWADVDAGRARTDLGGGATVLVAGDVAWERTPTGEVFREEPPSCGELGASPVVAAVLQCNGATQATIDRTSRDGRAVARLRTTGRRETEAGSSTWTRTTLFDPVTWLPLAGEVTDDAGAATTVTLTCEATFVDARSLAADWFDPAAFGAAGDAVAAKLDGIANVWWLGARWAAAGRPAVELSAVVAARSGGMYDALLDYAAVGAAGPPALTLQELRGAFPGATCGDEARGAVSLSWICGDDSVLVRLSGRTVLVSGRDAYADRDALRAVADALQRR